MKEKQYSLNKLAKKYSEGKLEYAEYKRLRTILLKDIVSGKYKISQPYEPASQPDTTKK